MPKTFHLIPCLKKGRRNKAKAANMYGYKHGIRSSRKLEHAIKVNIELWWLLEGQTPSDRTIAAFRKENNRAFKNAFHYFVHMFLLKILQRQGKIAFQ